MSRIRWTLGLAVFLLARTGAASGQEAERMIKLTNIESSYPFWSPDGSQLVFQSDRNGNSEIYISSVDGTGLRRLTDHPADDFTPVWSPDGTRILFQSNRTGREQLFVINVDGTGLRQITDHPSNQGHPKWGPDGSTIIFNSTRADSTNDDIYEMAQDGSGVRRLTSHPHVDSYASISPDGLYIAFRRVMDAAGFDAALNMGARNSEVFTARRDGSDAVNVTSSAAYDGWPSWSPASDRLAFASNRSGQFHIFVMARDGSSVRRLTSGPGAFTKPIWSPDGRRIVCTRTLDGDVAIVILEVDLGEGVQSRDHEFW